MRHYLVVTVFPRKFCLHRMITDIHLFISIVVQFMNFFVLFTKPVPIAQVTIQTAPLDRDPIEVQIGKTQKFICLTDEGRPSSKIHWYMSGANITDSSSQSDMCNSNCNGTFASSSVLVYTGNLADDGKNIYCTASNTESRSVRSYNRTVVILCKYNFNYLKYYVTLRFISLSL